MTQTIKCTDLDTGALIHAYEIGILTAEDIERFELHLMDCEHCMSQVSKFENEMVAIRTDESIQQQTSKAVKKIDKDSSYFSKILELISFRKPTIAYIIVLLLIYPAYLGLFTKSNDEIQTAQTINLMPTRASTPFKITQNDNYILTFVYYGAVEGKQYQIVLKSENGITIWYSEEFAGFDQFEIGRIIIPAKLMEPSKYSLTITDMSLSKSETRRTQQYEFKLTK